MVFRPPLPIPSTPHFQDDGKPTIQKHQWLTSIDNMFGSFNATASGDLLANTTNASGMAVPVTLTSFLDFVMGSTRGEILVRAASTWTVLALGATNTVLTSNGTDPTYAAIPTTERVLLNTLTATNSASLSDTTSITSTYANYEVVFENLLPSTNGATPLFRIRSGTAFQATTYLSSCVVGNTGGGTAAGTQTTGVLVGRAVDNTGPGVSGVIRFSNPSVSALHLLSGTSYYLNGGLGEVASCGGYWNSSATVNGIRFIESSGTITSGNVYIYGLA